MYRYKPYTNHLIIMVQNKNQTMISNDGNGSIVRSSVLQLMVHHKTIHVLISSTMEYYIYIHIQIVIIH